METKNCAKCKQDLPRDNFHKRKDVKDGLQSSCKACHKTRQRVWTSRTIGEIEVTSEQQLEAYAGVIRRMHRLGLMSRDYAQDALKRVLDENKL